MNLPIVTENIEVWIGFGLFILSEAIGISKAKQNSVLQLVLHMASELFPYEVQRRERATRENRPRRKRDERGRFTD
jgi:hypothetical protein